MRNGAVLRRVLIVEDETDIVKLIQDVFDHKRYAVRCASDAEAALELLRAERFDIAILDFFLPGIDGVDLHRRIAAIDPVLASRTIFISGLVQSKANLDYFLTHGATYLAKPFKVDDLLETVERVLGGA